MSLIFTPLAPHPTPFWLSHSRHAPCAWRTSKSKTSWECCHANMLSTGSEYNYQRFFFPSNFFFLLRPSCRSWPSSTMNGEHLTAAAAGAPVRHRWHLRMKGASTIVAVWHVTADGSSDTTQGSMSTCSYVCVLAFLRTIAHTHFRQSCQIPGVLSGTDSDFRFSHKKNTFKFGDFSCAYLLEV